MTLPVRVVDDPKAQLNFETLGSLIFYGVGTPLGRVPARIGATYHRLDGGALTSFYVKESGTDATGWVAK